MSQNSGPEAGVSSSPEQEPGFKILGIKPVHTLKSWLVNRWARIIVAAGMIGRAWNTLWSGKPYQLPTLEEVKAAEPRVEYHFSRRQLVRGAFIKLKRGDGRYLQILNPPTDRAPKKVIAITTDKCPLKAIYNTRQIDHVLICNLTHPKKDKPEKASIKIPPQLPNSPKQKQPRSGL